MLKTGEAPLRISRSFLNEAPRDSVLDRSLEDDPRSMNSFGPGIRGWNGAAGRRITTRSR